MSEKKFIADLRPTGRKMLILPCTNPYVKKESELDLIMDSGMHKSEDTGEIEKSEMLVLYAEVVEVGEDVQEIKAGDGVFYFRHAQVLPLPFYDAGFLVMEEGAVLARTRPTQDERQLLAE